MGEELFVNEFKLKDGQNISKNWGNCSWQYRRLFFISLVLFVILSFLNSAMLTAEVVEAPKVELTKNDTNHAEIEETFLRRRLIYQRACSLIKKLITLNKKGLTNQSDLISIHAINYPILISDFRLHP